MKHKRVRLAGELLILALLAVSVAGASGAFSLDEYETYQIRLALQVVNDGGPATEVAIRIPLFMTENLPPYQTLRTFDVSSAQGLRLKSTETGQAAEINLPSLPKGGRFQAELTFSFYNAAIEYNLERSSGWDRGELRYLRPEPGIESEAPAIRALAERLARDGGDPVAKAKNIFAYVNTNFKYERLDQSSAYSALRTLQAGRGVCTDLSVLYAALCRAAGIPARIVSGYRFDPKEIGARETDLNRFAHAWTEVYLSGLGWVPADPTSFTYQNGALVTSFTHFGRIAGNDRHLFAHYGIEEKLYESTHKYNPGKPARIKITVQKLIKKI